MNPDVTINGVRYVPAEPIRRHSVGVAISTHNRRPFFLKSIEAWREYADGALIVVVDDASDEPAPGADLRFEKQQGIARTKNACIELLMNAGVEHLFLVDDDTYPTRDGWSELYVKAGIPHMMYLFPDSWRGATPGSPPIVYDDGVTYARTMPRGCLLYVHRTVVESIGGMRPEFGLWGHEHVEYSLRAHAAGFTAYPYQDACGSRDFIYASDEREPDCERTLTHRERKAAVDRNDALLEEFRDSTDFVDYRRRADENVVVTTLFTKRIDPQRGTKMKPDIDLVGKWRASLQNCRPVILTDEIAGDNETIFCSPTGTNPYMQRWVSLFRWLTDNPARWVWATDGTDVEMLQSPWDHMTPGKLYVGHEPTVVGISWMRDNHKPYAEWIDANADRQLLNAGVVGGDHNTMLDFSQDMCRMIASKVDHGVGDMAALNAVAYSPKWRDRLVWGSRWVTGFKRDERNAWSMWKHK